MNSLPMYIELAVSGVVVACCVALLTPHLLRVFGSKSAACNAKFHVLIFCIAAAALLIPINEIPVLYYIRGALGDFSVTTLIWVVVAFIARLRNKNSLDPRQRFVILLIFSLTSMVFYPMTLGLTRIDPYAFGYFSTPFLIGMGLLCCVALAFQWYWAVFMLCSSLIIASMELFQSSNAWDYLIDPAFAIHAIIASAVEIIRRIRDRTVVSAPGVLDM